MKKREGFTKEKVNPTLDVKNWFIKRNNMFVFSKQCKIDEVSSYCRAECLV